MDKFTLLNNYCLQGTIYFPHPYFSPHQKAAPKRAWGGGARRAIWHTALFTKGLQCTLLMLLSFLKKYMYLASPGLCGSVHDLF